MFCDCSEGLSQSLTNQLIVHVIYVLENPKLSVAKSVAHRGALP